MNPRMTDKEYWQHYDAAANPTNQYASPTPIDEDGGLLLWREIESMRIIRLRGRDYDKEPRDIIVERETDTDWFGAPVANPACPVLQWPKFAWEVCPSSD